jgi:hypothetical protein
MPIELEVIFEVRGSAVSADARTQLH